MNKYGIWDLDKYKVEGKNKYSDMVDETVSFDFRHRELAIRDLFESTTDQDVKQVLKYAMELNNYYRKQAIDLFNNLDAINDLRMVDFIF